MSVMTARAAEEPCDAAAQRWLGAYERAPVVVLGATGFIGRRVVRALSARGAVVTAAGRDAAALGRLRAETLAKVVVCDAAREDDVVSLIRGAGPVITFNLAGYGVDRTERDEATAQRVNVELPGLLAEVIAAHATGWRGQALVHAGSALEYGAAAGDLREDTRPVATTLYGRTKLQGTLAVMERCRSSGMRGVTARLFTVYGPGELPGRLLPALLEAARSGRPLELTAGTQRRDFTYVDDVADGLLRLGLAAAAPGEVVNLATGRLETVRAFVERAARVIGMDESLLRFGAVPVRQEEMSHDPVSVHRLRALTGWTPATSIENGVRFTLQETAPTHG
jgi:nucleoside-diphosphate-sugar epimerase